MGVLDVVPPSWERWYPILRGAHDLTGAMMWIGTQLMGQNNNRQHKKPS